MIKELSKKQVNKNMKNFNDWNQQKQKVHEDEQRLYFYEQEIWFCKMGVNIGFEQDGKGEDFRRPIVVIKKFNKEVFLGVPLTAQIKKGKYYFPMLKFNKKDNFAIISQLRLVDSKRLIRRLHKMKINEFLELKKAIVNLIIDNDDFQFYAPDYSGAGP
jgi:mRNA interferase MazF